MSLTWSCLTLLTFTKPYPEPPIHEQASLPGFIPSLWRRLMPGLGAAPLAWPAPSLGSTRQVVLAQRITPSSCSVAAPWKSQICIFFPLSKVFKCDCKLTHQFFPEIFFMMRLMLWPPFPLVSINWLLSTCNCHVASNTWEHTLSHHLQVYFLKSNECPLLNTTYV